MRALAVVVVVVGGSALAAPAETAPPPPKDMELDLSKLVLQQTPKPAPQKTLVLCRLGDKGGCEAACADKSPTSCARLGWTLATGGADNPLLPTKQFEQDFVGAEKAFDTSCKLGFLPACVDAEMARRALKKPKNETRLRATCKAGYGRACSELAASLDAVNALPLYEQGCAGGDGEACMAVADSKTDMKEQLTWYAKAFNTPTKAKVPLTCPASTQAVRTVSSITFAWTLYTPKWACGRFDPATRRFVEDGPYIELDSEEDEAVYPYGIISKRGTMVAGKSDGLVEHWNSRGALLSLKTYKAGREDGVAYDLMRGSNGAIEFVTQVTYVAGKREGVSRHISMYDDNEAHTFETGEYKAGEKVGTWTTTHMDTKHVVLVERFVAGKPEGNRDSFDRKTGALVQRDVYVATKRTKSTSYDGGKVFRETAYINGNRSEERDFDAAGKVKAITTYDADDPHAYRAIGRKIRDKRGNFVADPDFD